MWHFGPRGPYEIQCLKLQKFSYCQSKKRVQYSRAFSQGSGKVLPELAQQKRLPFASSKQAIEQFPVVRSEPISERRRIASACRGNEFASKFCAPLRLQPTNTQGHNLSGFRKVDHE